MTVEKGNKCVCCLILGVVLIVLGLSADYIGIGGGMGYGLKQIAVIVLGFVLLILGTRAGKFSACCKLGKKE